MDASLIAICYDKASGILFLEVEILLISGQISENHVANQQRRDIVSPTPVSDEINIVDTTIYWYTGCY